jgi:acyl transferase domain-containing protein
MNKPIVFMFSGQGSQYYGMGKELFNKHPTFRKWMFKLDGIVRQNIGKSIIDEIYNEKKDKTEKFDRTLFTHPAIFMVEYSLARVLLESGIKPDYILGASMGEFCSAAVTNIMTIEDIVESLINQAITLETYCKNGNMIAIIQNANLYYENPLLFENSELASINFHSHFVISGEMEKLKFIVSFLKSQNINFQVLPVTYGFHSSYIDSAKKTNIDFLFTKSFNKPTFPFISCLYGNQVPEIPVEYLWDVIRKPILFQKAIQEMERAQEYIYIDLGPSGTLANFTKQNLSKDSTSTCHSIMTLFNQDYKNLQTIGNLFRKPIL